MTLPTTGVMTAEMISTELGRASSTTMSMDESAIRSMAGKLTAGSAVAMQDFYGKSKDTPYYIGTVTIGFTSGSGYAYYGFQEGGFGARNPTTVDGFNWWQFIVYTDGVATPYLVMTGNATGRPWATGNGKITIGTAGTFALSAITYDSKFDWSQFYITPYSAALASYIAANNGQTVSVRIAV